MQSTLILSDGRLFSDILKANKTTLSLFWKHEAVKSLQMPLPSHLSHGCFCLLTMGCTDWAHGSQTQISRSIDLEYTLGLFKGTLGQPRSSQLKNILTFSASWVYTHPFHAQCRIQRRETLGNKKP